MENTKKVEIANMLVKYLNKKIKMSFADIDKFFDSIGFDYKGDNMIGNVNNNVVAWAGWNDDAVDVYNEFMENSDKYLHIRPVSKNLYIGQGRTPNPKIFKWKENPIPSKPYKNPCWVPMLLEKNGSAVIFTDDDCGSYGMQCY